MQQRTFIFGEQTHSGPPGTAGASKHKLRRAGAASEQRSVDLSILFGVSCFTKVATFGLRCCNCQPSTRRNLTGPAIDWGEEPPLCPRFSNPKSSRMLSFERFTRRHASTGSDIGSASRRSADTPDSFVSFLLCARFAFLTKLVDLILGQMLDPDEHVFDLTHPDELIKLDLNSGTVAVLRVLNQEDHQKRYDGRSGITMVVPVLMMSCQVSEYLKMGPLPAHPTIITRARKKEGRRPPRRPRHRIGEITEEL
jgi:hypothetical protein